MTLGTHLRPLGVSQHWIPDLPQSGIAGSQTVFFNAVSGTLSVSQGVKYRSRPLHQSRRRGDRSGERPTTERIMGDTPPDEQDLDRVIELLNDEHGRTILAATSAQPHSADELADRCGLSASNIYRRLGELQDVGLLRKQTRPRPDGNHESVYTTALTAIELRFEDGELTWSLTRDDGDVADELTRMWRNFK